MKKFSDKTFSVRLAPEWINIIDGMAEKLNMSRVEFIRWAIESKIKEIHVVSNIGSETDWENLCNLSESEFDKKLSEEISKNPSKLIEEIILPTFKKMQSIILEKIKLERIRKSLEEKFGLKKSKLKNK